MRATNIVWEINPREESDCLPDEVELPSGMTAPEDIDNFLSELTGYCHLSYCLEQDSDIQIG